MHLPDFLSLGHWAMTLAAKIGLPSTSEISDWVAGDWEKVSRAADACRHLGEFCSTLAAETRTQLGRLDQSWSGNAADAATRYFEEMAASLDDNARSFGEVAGQLDQTALGVHQSAKLIGDQMEDVIDLAIVLGIEAAAAAATAPTGVGPAVSAAAMAATVWQGYTKVKAITGIHANAVKICEAVVGLTATPLATIKGFTTTALPAPYDNLQVN